MVEDCALTLIAQDEPKFFLPQTKEFHFKINILYFVFIFNLPVLPFFNVL